jgi:hypothetical protein
MRDDLNPIIRRFRALNWRRRVANGENPDVAPSTVDMYVRILEEEDAAEAGQDRRPDLAAEDELH